MLYLAKDLFPPQAGVGLCCSEDVVLLFQLFVLEFGRGKIVRHVFFSNYLHRKKFNIYVYTC